VARCEDCDSPAIPHLIEQLDNDLEKNRRTIPKHHSQQESRHTSLLLNSKTPALAFAIEKSAERH
jgi:hypothetical protein